MDSCQDGKRLQGKTVLMQYTGGVSCSAIQTAAALGAMIIVNSSNNKLKVAKEIGATHVINYVQTPDWEKGFLYLTNSKGVDNVIEPDGSSTLLQSVNSVRNGGLISLIGILSEHEAIDALLMSRILQGGKIGDISSSKVSHADTWVVKGVVMFSWQQTAGFARSVEKHYIRPIIARKFEFQNAHNALQALEDQAEAGKIAIKISDE